MLNKNKSIKLAVVILVLAGLVYVGVVLSQSNSLRDKTPDEAVISNLNNVTAQAELYYDNFGTYSGACEDQNIANALASASNTVGDTSEGRCIDGENFWLMWHNFKTDSEYKDSYYCVDYIGNKTLVSSPPGGDATMCPPGSS